MTAEAFFEHVDLHPKAKAAGHDMKGRFWDILTMLRYAIKGQGGKGEIRFKFYSITRASRRAKLCTLKATMGPGDQGEPVLTIMLPEQD
jgi:hypothetical protein